MKPFKKCIKFLSFDWWYIPFKWVFFTSEGRKELKRRDKFVEDFYESVAVCKKGFIKNTYYENGVVELIEMLKVHLKEVCEEGLFSKKECKHFREWLKKEAEDGE